MKNSILILSLLISNLVFSQTSAIEADFRQTLDLIIKDAGTGFSASKGNTESKSVGAVVNKSTISFFNKEATIRYNTSYYLPYSKVTVPESYLFYQEFKSVDDNEKFVFDNLERIFDEIMVLKKLKKKILKQDKYDKGKSVEIEYLDQYKDKVLSLYYYKPLKRCSIYIYSNKKPNVNLPKYLGCLILYNIQLNSIVSANTYYVYGNDFKGEQYLNDKILSKMDATSQRLFSKYEWKPNAGEKQIFDLLKSLNVRENGHNVDVEGNLIK